MAGSERLEHEHQIETREVGSGRSQNEPTGLRAFKEFNQPLNPSGRQNTVRDGYGMDTIAKVVGGVVGRPIDDRAVLDHLAGFVARDRLETSTGGEVGRTFVVTC